MKTLTKSIMSLVVGLVLASSLQGGKDPGKGTPSTINQARRTGWQLALVVVERLEAGDQSPYPGIQAWLKDFQKIAGGTDRKPVPDPFPAIEVDSLISRNPSFWQAYYEIAPGDPGLMMLHAGLLLSAGEASRASYLSIIAGQRPGVPKEIRQGFETILTQARKLREQPDSLVLAGTKLHDKGDYLAALKKYRESLALWPQNGLAHFEMGLTLMSQELVQAGEKPPEGDAVIVNNNRKFSSEVRAAYAKARLHDPFQIKAYQGDDQEVIRGLLALVKKGMPCWQKIVQNRQEQVDQKELEQLADACQEARVDDLALVIRQVLVARRGRYAPADHPFITTSLRRLAPGRQTEKTLNRLAGKEELALRQLVEPELGILAEAPAKPANEKNPVFEPESIILYQDPDQFGNRLGDQLGPFADYCKAVAKSSQEFWQTLPKGQGQTMLLIVFLKPEQQVRFWFNARNKVINPEDLDRLQKKLATLKPIKIQNGPVVIAWKIDLWGGLSGKAKKKEGPAPEDILFPKEWLEAAQAKKITLKVPLSDEVFRTVWPD